MAGNECWTKLPTQIELSALKYSGRHKTNVFCWSIVKNWSGKWAQFEPELIVLQSSLVMCLAPSTPPSIPLGHRQYWTMSYSIWATSIGTALLSSFEMPLENLGVSEEEAIAVPDGGHHSLVHPSNPKRASVPTQGRGLFDLSPASPRGKICRKSFLIAEQTRPRLRPEIFLISRMGIARGEWWGGWESSLLAKRKKWMVKDRWSAGQWVILGWCGWWRDKKNVSSEEKIGGNLDGWRGSCLTEMALGPLTLAGEI